MVPPVEMLRPEGRPVAVKVYGPPAPPLPVRVTGVIATPCTALMDTQLALTGGLMVMVQAVPTAPLASVTFTVKVPEAVGVPVMAPVTGFRVSPAGSVPLPIEKV